MRGVLPFLLVTVAGCAGAAEVVTDVEPSSTGTPATSAAALPVATAAPAEAESGAPQGEGSATPRAYAPLTEDMVRETVRLHYDRMGDCYTAGLARDPSLAGTIEVHLSIGDDGKVVSAFADKDTGNSSGAKGRRPKPPRRKPRGEPQITDAEVVGCVEGVFTSLTFPPTGRGLVNLVYPVVLRTE